MSVLRVAGAQMAIGADIDANTGKILASIDKASNEQADLLLTPEGSLSGYTPDFDTDHAVRNLNKVTRYAREKELGLALGTCYFEQDKKCYNQIRFYDPDGTYLGFHSKILRCGSMTETPQGEINHYAATALKTFSWNNDVTFGGLICNDLWANPACTPMPDPHLSQQLSTMNAQIIFHAVNGGRNGSEWSKVAWQFHESNLRMRAQAGKIWIVVVDNAAPTDIPCSAPSGVINPTGDWVCRTERVGEDFFVCDIPIKD